MQRRSLLAVLSAAAVLGAASASASGPLALRQPVGIDVAPNGSLLVVEFDLRRLVRVDPATGRATKLATFVKPWGVVRAPSGRIYVSDGVRLRRLDPGRAPVTVATAPAAFEIGPVAVTANGDVVYATATALYRLRGGKGTPRPVAPGTMLNSAHGIAVTADGALLVSDSNSNRILRVRGTSVTTFATVGHPRGIDVARNGTVYALDMGATGIIRRIAPNGTASVVAAP